MIGRALVVIAVNARKINCRRVIVIFLLYSLVK